VSCDGGGGAGIYRNAPPTSNYNGIFNASGLAGNGIKCNLGEINSFIPNPNPSNYSSFETYYWGRGGGAGGDHSGGSYYVGGKGGGGAGASSTGVGTRDTNGINVSADIASKTYAGNGAPNTGGGGTSGGDGGSGIAVIVIPQA
jgi:hypothetical protein